MNPIKKATGLYGAVANVNQQRALESPKMNFQGISKKKNTLLPGRVGLRDDHGESFVSNLSIGKKLDFP